MFLKKLLNVLYKTSGSFLLFELFSVQDHVNSPSVMFYLQVPAQRFAVAKHPSGYPWRPVEDPASAGASSGARREASREAGLCWARFEVRDSFALLS